MLLLSDPLGTGGAAVPAARLLATLLGCALAFVLGYPLWPEDLRGRIPHRLATLCEDLATYAELAAAGPPDLPGSAGHALRRKAHRQSALVRAELQRRRTDPRHRSALVGWTRELERCEELTERLTGRYALPTDPSESPTGTPGTSPAPAPASDSVSASATARDLRERARALRAAQPRER